MHLKNVLHKNKKVISVSVKSWKEKVLKPNFYIAFEFSQGFVAAQVRRVMITKKEPYRLYYDANYNPQTLTPSIGWVDWYKPRDTSGKYIFTIDNNNEVIQVFLGLRPTRLKLYFRIPSGTPIKNLPYNPVTEKVDYGFINGIDSPYDEPTEAGELWFIRDLTCDFALYNDTDKIMFPEAKIIYVRYWVDFLRGDLARKVVTGELPCYNVTIGGFIPTSIENTKWRELWNANQIEVIKK